MDMWLLIQMKRFVIHNSRQSCESRYGRTLEYLQIKNSVMITYGWPLPHNLRHVHLKWQIIKQANGAVVWREQLIIVECVFSEAVLVQILVVLIQEVQRTGRRIHIIFIWVVVAPIRGRHFSLRILLPE